MYIYGDNGIKIPLPSGGGVEDVTINGTSIVDDTTGVASIPIGNSTTYGVYKVNETNGIGKTSSDILMIARATDADITGRSSYYKPIVPKNLDFAVKAALTDGTGPAYTSEEQAAARTRLGIDYPVKDVKIIDTSIVDPNTGVATLSWATSSTYGLVKVYSTSNSSQGIVLGTDGVIRVAPMVTPISTNRRTDNKRGGEAVIGKVLDEAVKAALTDGVGPAYTSEEQAAARTRLGIDYPVKGVKVNNVNVVGSDGVANITVGQLGGVDDVQIAHNSIVDEYGVAQIPYATYSNLGMVRLYNNEAASGLYVNVYSGDLSISPATLSMIQAAPPDSDVKSPIIPANQHQAVFYGLAKAAGDTYQGGSGYPVGSYIPPAKTAIQEMIGLKIVTQAQYDAIVGADSDGNIYFITED